jgi:hypothetical protein
MTTESLRASFATLLAVFAFEIALSWSRPAAADSLQLISQVEPGSRSLTGGAPSLTRSNLRGKTVSADGRWVAFESTSVNLVPGQNDVTGTRDVFLSDRTTGDILLVSRSAASPVRAGHGDSSAPVLSADGRYVAFLSTADDLVPGQIDSNEDLDVFLFDRMTGVTTLISHAATGAAMAGNLPSSEVTISADGSRVAFTSRATDLITGQSSWDGQVFLFDRPSGTTALVSHKAGSRTIAGSGDADSPSLSADGNLLAYTGRAPDLVNEQNDLNGDSDVFLYSFATGASILVSRANELPATTGNHESYLPVISADGNSIAFSSLAADLISGLTGPAVWNIYLYDRSAGTVTLVSHSSIGATRSGNGSSYVSVLSADGGSVAFVSYAGDLVPSQLPSSFTQVYLWRRSTGVTALASHAASSPSKPGNNESYSPQLSTDGSQLLFESKAHDLPGPSTTHSTAAYLYDRGAGVASLISRGPGDGTVQGLDLSADGTTGVFTSSAVEVPGDRNSTNDVFRYARATGVTTLVSQHPPGTPSLTPAAESSLVSLSDDGNYITFLSRAGDLIPGESDATSFEADLYLYSRPAATMTLVSHSAASPVTTGNHGVGTGKISRDGGWVLYSSTASNVLTGQTGTDGIYLFDRATGNRILVNRSHGSPTSASSGVAQAGDLSIDGRWIAFSGFFTDLIPGQSTGSRSNVFLFDRLTGATALVSHALGSSTTGGNGLSAWTEPPAISGDGRWIAFESEATNLVTGQGASTDGNIFFYDRDSGAVSLLSHAAGSPAAVWGDSPQISTDGRYVAFLSSGLLAGETGPIGDNLYLWDRLTGGLAMINHATSSPAQRPNDLTDAPTSLSADGRFAVYQSHATNIVAATFPPVDDAGNVYLYDRTTGLNTLVSHAAVSPTRAGNNPSYQPVISADGRYVTFTSVATDLVPGQVSPYYTANVFLWDRLADRTVLVSRKGDAATGGDGNGPLAIGADGGAVAFLGGPLVPGDDNERPDVYVFQHDLPGTDFFTLPPCRLLDTRESGPAMASGVREVLTVQGACGIPSTAQALAVNVTVVQPTGSGHLIFSPADATTASSTLNFSAGSTRANNAVLRLALDATGALAVVPAVAGNGTVHVILDVTGYFQ